MKYLGLILSQTVFLLDFCFKIFDFSATQVAHFDACLITLFVITNFYEPTILVCFLQLKKCKVL